VITARPILYSRGKEAGALIIRQVVAAQHPAQGGQDEIPQRAA